MIGWGMARSKATCGCEACKAHPRTTEAAEHRKVCRAIAGLDEKHARRVVGLLASMKGRGGTTLFSMITGMSRTTVLQGQRELGGRDPIPGDRVRRPGGGRTSLEKRRPRLTVQLHKVLEGTTAGDPMSTVKWTRKSTRCVSRALRVSHTKARKMLRAHKYRLRVSRKSLARKASPDRDRQFRQINRLTKSFTKRSQPVISVDAKKRELVGVFKNQGRTWSRSPVDVNIYDFPSDADGVAIPYGIYDVARGDGTVVVGTSHNTPAFATNAIDSWWTAVGKSIYSKAKELSILADSGSSNGVRAHAWKQGLQEIANKTGLRITVAHYPTGASKWNPVEHRLFGPISTNWAGRPLSDYKTICNLIRHTRTTSGNRCKAILDRRRWPTSSEVKKAKKTKTRKATPSIPKAAPVIHRAKVLPNLNYTIAPTGRPRK